MNGCLGRQEGEGYEEEEGKRNGGQARGAGCSGMMEGFWLGSTKLVIKTNEKYMLTKIVRGKKNI